MCASRAPQASVQRWASESQDEEHSITPTATSLRLHHQSGPYGGGGGGTEIFMSGAFAHTPMRLPS